MAHFSLLLDAVLEETIPLAAAEGHLGDEGGDGLIGGTCTGLLWCEDWPLELILIIIPTTIAIPKSVGRNTI